MRDVQLDDLQADRPRAVATLPHHVGRAPLDPFEEFLGDVLGTQRQQDEPTIIRWNEDGSPVGASACTEGRAEVGRSEFWMVAANGDDDLVPLANAPERAPQTFSQIDTHLLRARDPTLLHKARPTPVSPSRLELRDRRWCVALLSAVERPCDLNVHLSRLALMVEPSESLENVRQERGMKSRRLIGAEPGQPPV